jgi:hypothetical protein
VKIQKGDITKSLRAPIRPVIDASVNPSGFSRSIRVNEGKRKKKTVIVDHQ